MPQEKAPREFEVIHERWVIRKLYRRERSEFWYAHVRDRETGRVRWFSTGKKDRRKAKQQALNRIKKLEALDQKKTRSIRFDQAFEEFLGLKDVRAITSKCYKLTFKGVYEPVFGNEILEEIHVGDIERFIKQPREGRESSARTKRKYLSELRSFFTWAMRRKYCTENPCEGMRVARGAKRQGVALSLKEARRLLKACQIPETRKVKDSRRGEWKQKFRPPSHLFLAVLISLHTGLRRANVTGLRLRHLDLKNRKIIFTAGEMKANADHHLPIHQELLEVLKVFLQAQNSIYPESPILGKKLFQATKSFKSALTRAKLPEIRWHDLRHTFATWTGSRAPYAVWRALLGHSPGTVSEKYFHAPFDELKRVIDGMPRILDRIPSAKELKLRPIAPPAKLQNNSEMPVNRLGAAPGSA